MCTVKGFPTLQDQHSHATSQHCNMAHIFNIRLILPNSYFYTSNATDLCHFITLETLPCQNQQFRNTKSNTMAPTTPLLPIQEPGINERPPNSGPIRLRELKRYDIFIICLCAVPASVLYFYMIKVTFLLFISLIGISVIGMIGMRIVLGLTGVANNNPYIILFVTAIVLIGGWQKGSIRGDGDIRGHRFNGVEILGNNTLGI
jgi:hypothetical protein